MIEEAPRESSEGATPSPLAFRAYAMLMKSQLRLTYAELAARLGRDPAVQRLGWMRTKPISINSLCSSIAVDERLDAIFDWMLTQSALVGRLIETEGALDSSGLSMIMVANYNESKHKKARKRKGKRFLKPHTMTGPAIVRKRRSNQSE